MVTHLSTNPARRGVTSLVCSATLPLSHTATTDEPPRYFRQVGAFEYFYENEHLMFQLSTNMHSLI